MPQLSYEKPQFFREIVVCEIFVLTTRFT